MSTSKIHITLATLLATVVPAAAQVALDKNYDCEAEWALYCGADAAACQKAESIVAERSFSVDLKRRMMDAALYSAIFSGSATIRVSKDSITATGVLASQHDPKSGKIFAGLTLRRADARFSMSWRSDGDLGMTFAVGTCVARDR